ncbi:MAG: hypothetical protein KGZ58_02690, partial [Ignavibacteriales bacterium]|nr:hypothetical protein [Ignavibacteriales bacterium]
MAKILGLDLGTNSIGWAVIDYERNYKKESFSIVEKGVHIFTEGVDKDSYGNPQSRAAERTDRRGARRLKFRRKLRKYETLKALIKHKMCPLDIEELEKWRSYKNPETGKIETFKHYPTSKEFFNWLNTDNQHDKVDRKLQKKNPYYFRDFASREKLFNLHELGRAFYHLAQRRGFLSNRLDKSDEGIIEKHKPNLEYRIKEANNAAELLQETETYFDTLDIIYKQSKDLNEGDKKLKTLYNFFKKTIQEPNTTIEVVKRNLIERLNRKENLGKVKEGIFDLSEKIKKENCKTLGQYFYKCFQEGKKIRKTYTAREEQYEEEFKEMCKVQGFNEDGEIYKDLHNAIFFQRKLKSQKGLVGKCTLEPNKPRCPISHPSFEEFRTLKFINNIKMKVDNEWRVLNEEEKKKIWHKFFRKSKAHFDFKEIAKDIRSDYPVCEKPTDEPDPKKNFFNYKGNATVTGCQTLSYLMDLFGKDWEQTNWKTRSWQDILENPAWKKNLFEKCMKKEIKSRTTKEVIGMKDIETVANDVWHALFIYDKESNLYKFAKNYFGADNIVANKFSSPTIQLKREYASFSLKAINNIIPFLREGLIETYAVFLAKMPELIPDKWSNEE